MIDDRVFPKERIRRLANMVASRALDDVLNVIDLNERFPDLDLREAILDEVQQIAIRLKQHGETAPRISEQAAARYAKAVTELLADDFDGLKAPTLSRIVTENVARQAEAPMVSFELIVDDLSLANWTLTPDPENTRRVVLACRRYKLRATDTRREDRVNAALRALPL